MSILAVAACAPEPTPFPVDDSPTLNSTPSQSAGTAVRYALAANTKGFVSDLNMIQAAAQVEQLTEEVNPADLGSRYDLVAAYGDLPGGTRSPITPHITLIISASVPPLTDPTVTNIVRHGLNPSTIIESLTIPGAEITQVETSPPLALRTELANAGWPDGVRLNLAYAYTPGANQIGEQLQLTGIHVRLSALSEADVNKALTEGSVQAALILWTTSDERQRWVSDFGDQNVIDLYSLPISYLAAPGITVSFTPGGWPIPNR